MPKAFAIIRMVGGKPDIDPELYPYKGYTFCDSIDQWGAYIISGTGAQLTAINGLSWVYGIVAVTNSGDVHWPELDGTIASAVRTRLNTWLTARGYPNIPSGWSYRRVVREIYQRLNADFDIENFDIVDA